MRITCTTDAATTTNTFGRTTEGEHAVATSMFPTSTGSDDGFDALDSFVPEHLPDPGRYLTDSDPTTNATDGMPDEPTSAIPDEATSAIPDEATSAIPDEATSEDASISDDDHDLEVLEGDAHAAFHRLTARLFEERGVYDVTFGYNLARLNLDRRHPDAGFRYARARPVEDTDGRVLRAEFTPTTEFCPQTQGLTAGAFRAWNGRSDRHEYDLVSVRVHPMHQDAVAVNAELEALELAFLEDGSLTLPDADGSADAVGIGDAAVTDDEGGVNEESSDSLPF